MIYEAKNLTLVEPKVAGGHWEGGSRGVSFPTGIKGVRGRIGQSSGHYERGQERLLPIDKGIVTITTSRVVFQGPRQVREWPFSKMLGVIHAKDAHVTLIQISGRSKSSGIEYSRREERTIRAALREAASAYDDDNQSAESIGTPTKTLRPATPVSQPNPEEDNLAQLERLGRLRADGVLTEEEFAQEKARILSQRGEPDNDQPHVDLGPQKTPGSSLARRAVASGARAAVAVGKVGVAKAKEAIDARAVESAQAAASDPTSDAVSAGWYPDPSGRHELRWWDGEQWIGRVSDAGRTGDDPLPERTDE